MTVVVLGSANLDLVYRVRRLPGGGETVRANRYTEHPGGRGTHQAIAAARAGADVRLIAAVGNDPHGDLLEATLVASGVDMLLRRVRDPTGTALITVDEDGESSIVVNPGANASFTTLTDAEHAAISRAEHLLVQLEIPVETVIAGAEATHAHGGVVVLNAAPSRKLPRELLENVDVLVVNEHDALTCAADIAPEHTLPRSISVDGARDILAILMTVAPAVVVTLGAAGTVVLTREMGDSPAAHVPAALVSAIDTTGAGDTFCGALVAELDAGADLIDAAGFASAAAGLSVQRQGVFPSIPSRENILELRAKASPTTP